MLPLGTSCIPTNDKDNHMPPDRNQLLTVADVLNVTGFKSRTTLYRRARNGSFPCPCHIGAGKIRWRSGDVEDWLNSLQPRRY
jgi:prophage regulatory protein